MRLLSAFVLMSLLLMGQANRPPAEYRIYAGSTHAHTAYTWSHGEQFSKNGCTGIQVYAPIPSTLGFKWSDGYVKSASGCAGIYVINSFQYPGPSAILKPDWEKYQGPPSLKTTERYVLVPLRKGHDGTLARRSQDVAHFVRDKPVNIDQDAIAN